MSRKSKKPVGKAEFILFNVTYEDGSQTSNRRVPAAEVSPYDQDGSIRAILEAQDRKVAEMSGRSRGRIKTISRSA